MSAVMLVADLIAVRSKVVLVSVVPLVLIKVMTATSIPVFVAPESRVRLHVADGERWLDISERSFFRTK